MELGLNPKPRAEQESSEDRSWEDNSVARLSFLRIIKRKEQMLKTDFLIHVLNMYELQIYCMCDNTIGKVKSELSLEFVLMTHAVCNQRSLYF